jgi:hypothetical protein
MDLTPFEALYGRPFLQNDLILDPKVANLVSHITQLANFQQVLSEMGRGGAPGSLPGCLLSQRFSDKLPHDHWGLSDAPWKGPYLSLLSTPTGTKTVGLCSWIHIS